MDRYVQIRDEYNQIQQRRGLWSGFIMEWLRVMTLIGGVLFGFFSYLPWMTASSSVSWS